MTSRLLAAIWVAVFLAAGAAGVRAEEFTVSPTRIEELKAVFGEIKSRHVLPARARIGGTIAAVSVSEGTEVEKGQVIAKIVDDKIALQVDAAEAEIRAVQSQLGNARLDRDRAQTLFAAGSTTKSRLDQAQTQVDVFTSQLAAAEAKRAVITQQAVEGDIAAPEAGRVLTVPVTPGSVVLPGDTIAMIASGGYFLRLALPERHAAEISEGGSVTVGERVLSATDAPQPGSTRRGKLVKVYPEISDGRVLADVEVDGLGDYFVGERTLVWVPVAHRDVLAVPPAAVTTRHGVDYVRLTTPDGPLDVAVVLGETFQQGGQTLTEVLTGLAPGDRVLMP